MTARDAALRALIAWQEQDSDQAFAQEAETYVNIENTVDFWIFANLITGYDQRWPRGCATAWSRTGGFWIFI